MPGDTLSLTSICSESPFICSARGYAFPWPFNASGVSACGESCPRISWSVCWLGTTICIASNRRLVRFRACYIVKGTCWQRISPSIISQQDKITDTVNELVVAQRQRATLLIFRLQLLELRACIAKLLL